MTIKQRLQNLSENDLRKKIIIPLMCGLNCHRVTNLHGTRERGKDVLFFKKGTFRETVPGVILIKNDGDIIKSGPPNRSIQVILTQAQEAINTEIINPDDPNNKIKIKELIIMTSFEINGPAMEYINDNCLKSLPHITYIDGDKLCNLIIELIGIHKYKFKINTFKGFCESISNRKYDTTGKTSITKYSEGKIT